MMFGEKEQGDENRHITLKVLGQDDSVVKFRFIRNVPLKKLMDAYCDRVKLSRYETRFIYNYTRINDQDTPNSLKMQNEDTIDAGRIFGNSMYPKKEEPPTNGEIGHINLKFLGHDQSEIEFRVLRNDRMEKLINVYCQITNSQRQEIRVRFDGDVVDDHDTPMSLEMKEGDTIEIFQEQYSG